MSVEDSKSALARGDGEWLAEVLIDLEEDEPARLLLIDTLRSRA